MKRRQALLLELRSVRLPGPVRRVLRRLAVLRRLDAVSLELDGQAPELGRFGLAELVRLAVAVAVCVWLTRLRRLAVAGWRHRAPFVLGLCVGVWAACLALLAGGWVAS